MLNELLFLGQVFIICISTLIFAVLGKEALTGFVGLLFVMANIFVIKQINLFNWTVTSADIFIIGISFSINILQEFWGKSYAQKTVVTSFAISLFYLIIGKCILEYQPALVDNAHIHLAFVMENTSRIILASFISYLITQFIDIQIYSYLKEKTQGKYFTLRNYFSLSLSQLIDTILFSFLGLYGIVANITDIIILSYGIKILTILCMSPFLLISKRVIQRYQ
ncbi:queuosine precursor transporter [Candidatus Dependentiae bacterium]|nr:queuosine precursor transporter [Candidatus Dependentiae bacterium]